MKEDLQNFIYKETLLQNLYQQLASRTAKKEERDLLLLLANDAKNNVGFLEYLYKQEFGTNYNPIIPDNILDGDYQDVLNQLMEEELEGYLKCREYTYYQDDEDTRELMRKVADNKLSHVLYLQKIQVNSKQDINK